MGKIIIEIYSDGRSSGYYLCVGSNLIFLIVDSLEDFCGDKNNKKFRTVFPIVLHTLYNEDLLQEDAIFEWAAQKKDEEEENKEENSNLPSLYHLSEKFLEWLRQAEEESEEDDSDD